MLYCPQRFNQNRTVCHIGYAERVGETPLYIICVFNDMILFICKQHDKTIKEETFDFPGVKASANNEKGTFVITFKSNPDNPEKSIQFRVHKRESESEEYLLQQWMTEIKSAVDKYVDLQAHKKVPAEPKPESPEEIQRREQQEMVVRLRMMSKLIKSTKSNH